MTSLAIDPLKIMAYLPVDALRYCYEAFALVKEAAQFFGASSSVGHILIRLCLGKFAINLFPSDIIILMDVGKNVT